MKMLSFQEWSGSSLMLVSRDHVLPILLFCSLHHICLICRFAALLLGRLLQHFLDATSSRPYPEAEKRIFSTLWVPPPHVHCRHHSTGETFSSFLIGQNCVISLSQITARGTGISRIVLDLSCSVM